MNMKYRNVRFRTVMQETGKTRSALFADIRNGLFPPPYSIGGRAKAFAAHEIEAMNRARMAGLDDDEIRTLIQKLVRERAQLVA